MLLDDYFREKRVRIHFISAKMFVKYFTSSRDLAQLITCMNNYTLQLSPGDSSLICFLFVLICLSELVHRRGAGGTPIWNRRGCSSESLNLTPKGDHLGVV